MPVYLLYGFRWPRAGFTGIRVYIVLNNLENATAEYLQQPLTSELLLGAFRKTEGDAIVNKLPGLRFIEQYDPQDTTSNTAVSQPFAYVAARVIEIPNPTAPGSGLGWNAEDLTKESGLSEEALGALTKIRDDLAAGERIGWWIVYNGDPERYFPETDDEDFEEDIMEEDEDEANGNGHGNLQEQPQSLRASEKSSVCLFPFPLLQLCAAQ